MATRAQNVKVGLFVMICAGLMAAGILLIMGYKQEERYPYWIEFDESVLGLGKGSMVEYLGVPVGTVDDIFVTDSNLAHVEVLIGAKKVTLRQGVEAQLVMYSLATGQMAVSLEKGEPGNEMLKPGSQIPSKSSLLKTASERVETLLSNLDDIAAVLRKGLAGMEEGDLTEMLEHADGVLTRGQDFLDQANTALGDVKGDAKTVIEKLNGLADDVQELVANLDDTIGVAKGKIEGLDVDRTSENLNQALKKIAELTERLQKSATTVDTVTRSALHEADNIEYSMRETMRALGETLEAVRALSEYLRQDPSALVRGKGSKAAGEK